uniref:Uncharacterized protein n=1 Tax=Oryza meridionalis TaxID=40149 RepID=A0A0E0DFE1_9ORYZ
MRAAVSAPPPHSCYSRRRATLLDARHVLDHMPQRRAPPRAAGLRAPPAAASAPVSASSRRTRRYAWPGAPPPARPLQDTPANSNSLSLNNSCAVDLTCILAIKTKF